ncbi:LysM peptidoglycan-binding domain-containing protein [Aquibacillus albus]|uniref:Autolysin n=1 Tax=Aquibacillus albus TaxID=1168171 RepID=A0ABS2MWR4_9BACI|nr:LysM peptidoglycan-binding domain-containing protein [Aquibacillus albus]MBM7570228.1 LysM repeat protein [Aquibacillus albus]
MKLQSVFKLLFVSVLILGWIVNPNSSQARVQTNDLHLPIAYSKERAEKITHVMIHFISNAANNPQDPYNVNDVYRIFLDYGVSTHYMIGRNGEIYKMVNEDRVAFHAGKGSLPRFPAYSNNMNDYSIGIELLAIGTRDEMLPVIPAKSYDSISLSDIGFTEAQYRSLNRLLDDILDRHPFIKKDRNYIVGHEEYAPNRKTDPGKLFTWASVDFSQKHTVTKGETLWAIAKKYGVTIHDIATFNNMHSSSYLQVGQTLRIPAMYTVMSRDTLWEIAQKYGISVDTLVKWNGLENTYLQVGNRLRVPSGTIPYTVKSGDTLWRIAQNYNVSIDTIIKVNNLNPRAYLRIGQKLSIPR